MVKSMVIVKHLFLTIRHGFKIFFCVTIGLFTGSTLLFDEGPE